MPRMTLTCALCNLPMQNTPSSRPQGEATHNKCRYGESFTRSPKGVHGDSGYRRGCRCDVCRDAHNAKHRAYRAERKERDGIGLTARWRNKFFAEYGYWPQRGGGDWISPKIRHWIYDRDALTCYLCGDQLDRQANINNPKAPTLDHVIPRSKGGSDELDNLKTCCRECNLLKGDSTVALEYQEG